MFGFSSDSTHGSTTTATIPVSVKNSKFMRSNSSILSHTPITANTIPYNHFPSSSSTTTTTTNGSSNSIASSTNNSRRITSSPLINKYKSNQSTSTDNDSVTSNTSNGTNSNSTIATSIANSPPNTEVNSKLRLRANYNTNNNSTTHDNFFADDDDDYGAFYSPSTRTKRAPSIQSHNSQNSKGSHFNTLSSQQYKKEDSTYELIRMDTRVSLESYYVEQTQEQYKVQLNLDQRQIELIRYTWNKMLLEESTDLDNMPGAFTNNTTTSSNKKMVKNKTNTKIESSTIASSLFCRQFYFNLLSKDPELEKLFPSIKHQAVSFAGILTFTISQLENLSNLDEYLSKLGKLHARILNIEAPQFQLMGEALIQTFQERFGYKFNKELETLWIKFYLYLANSILQYGIDPVLKLSRYESNTTESLMSNNQSNIDLLSNTTTTNNNAFDSTSVLRDDLSSLEAPPSLTASSSISNSHFGASKSTLLKSSNNMIQLLSLQDTTILELKPGIKKKLHTRVKKAKGNNCAIM